MQIIKYIIDNRYSLFFFNNEYGLHIKTGFYLYDNKKNLISTSEDFKQDIIIKFLANKITWENNTHLINILTNQNRKANTL